MEEHKLVFIISQPRSGSTYLQNILSNNENVNTCSEPWILLNFTNFIKPELLQATYNYKWANLAFNDFLDKYPSIELSKRLKKVILDLYEPMAEGYDLVIDKTPRYWEILEEIMELFPKSKIIILKRHPMDVAVSIIKTWKITSLAKLSRFRRDLLLAPTVLHNFSERQLKNPRVYSLKYEDLINNKAEEVENLYNWLGLTYTHNVLKTDKNKKYKGLYGDPFQNNLATSNTIVNQLKDKPLSKDFEDFKVGYQHYLTPEFLNEYGNYSSGKGSETPFFKKFQYYDMNLERLNSKYSHIKNSSSFKIGQLILYPLIVLRKSINLKSKRIKCLLQLLP